MILTMAGSLVGVNLELLYLAGDISYLRELCRRVWVHISFRVLAPWSGAVALLMWTVSYASDP